MGILGECPRRYSLRSQRPGSLPLLRGPRQGLQLPLILRILCGGAGTWIESLEDEVLLFEAVLFVDEIFDDGVDHCQHCGLVDLPLLQSLLVSTIELGLQELQLLAHDILGCLLTHPPLLQHLLLHKSVTDMLQSVELFLLDPLLNLKDALVVHLKADPQSHCQLYSTPLQQVLHLAFVIQNHIQVLLLVNLPDQPPPCINSPLLFLISLVNLVYQSLMMSRLLMQMVLTSSKVNNSVSSRLIQFTTLQISAFLSKQDSEDVVSVSSLTSVDRGRGWGLDALWEQSTPARKSPSVVKPTSHLYFQRQSSRDLVYSLVILLQTKTSGMGREFLLLTIVATILVLGSSVWTEESDEVPTQKLSVSKKTYLQAVRCQGYLVPANYRKIQLTVEAQNLDHLLITDRQIHHCDQEEFRECSENANVCIQAQMSGTSEYSIGKCQESFYVYFYIRNYTGGMLIAKVNETSGCDNIVEDNFTICAGIPLSECGIKNSGSRCNPNCFRLDCSYRDSLMKNRTSLQMCLPVSVSSSMWNYKCNEEYSYSKSTQKHPLGYFCGKDKPMFSDNDQYRDESSSTSFGDIVWFLIKWTFYLSVVGVIVSVVYYRWALMKNGVRPFEPPQWAPEVMYPRGQPQGDPLENYREI